LTLSLLWCSTYAKRTAAQSTTAREEVPLLARLRPAVRRALGRLIDAPVASLEITCALAIASTYIACSKRPVLTTSNGAGCPDKCGAPATGA
jgi:hypothetical protein